MGIQKTGKGCFIIGAISAVTILGGIVVVEELIRKRKVKKYRLTEGFDDYSDCPYEIEPNMTFNITDTSECDKNACENCDCYDSCRDACPATFDSITRVNRQELVKDFLAKESGD